MTSKEILHKTIKIAPYALGIFFQIVTCAGSMNYGCEKGSGLFYGVTAIITLIAGCFLLAKNIINIITRES